MAYYFYLELIAKEDLPFDTRELSDFFSSRPFIGDFGETDRDRGEILL